MAYTVTCPLARSPTLSSRFRTSGMILILNRAGRYALRGVVDLSALNDANALLLGQIVAAGVRVSDVCRPAIVGDGEHARLTTARSSSRTRRPQPDRRR